MKLTNTNATAEAVTNYLNGGNTNNNVGWSSTAVADVDTDFFSYTEPQINNASKDTLVTSYGSVATNGLSTPLSGYFLNSSAGTQGEWDYWWSSTYDIDNDMYELNANPTGVLPYNLDRYFGISVRCLVF